MSTHTTDYDSKITRREAYCEHIERLCQKLTDRPTPHCAPTRRGTEDEREMSYSIADQKAVGVEARP